MWGRLPQPSPGSPAPPPRCEELAGSHSPPGPGTLCPPRPWAQLRNVGALHNCATQRCLRDLPAAQPLSPSPSLAGRRRQGQDGQFLPAGSSCSGAALPVPLRPGRGGQGPVPRVLTQRDSNGSGINLGLSRTSCSSTRVPWSRQSQAAKGGQAQPLDSICSCPMAPHSQDSSPRTHGR